jgi:hypothetical protein
MCPTPITDNEQLEMAFASSIVAGPRFGNGGVVSDNSPAPLLACFGALIAQEERVAASVKILISSLTPDMLAELVIVNMQHLPSTAPPLPPGVGPGVSGGLAGLLSSSTPQSVPLPPKSVAAAETIVPSFPPQTQPAEVTRDPRRVRLFFFTFTKIVQFLKPQRFDFGTEVFLGGKMKRVE